MDLSTMTPREVQDARREVMVLSQLDHPNITAYRESFQIDNSLHVIMEYADAGDLYTLLRERKKASQYFSEDEIMAHFVQILLALLHLHANHVLHRDLKTKNLFLTQRGLVKVGDFGIATVLTSTLAVAKTICGTPYYFSPELCQNRPYTLKSDVWAVGCVLYELAMLTYPFTGSGVRQLVGNILQGNFTPISSERYSADLVALSNLALTHDDAHRPSVAQLLAIPYVKRHIHRLQAQLSENALGADDPPGPSRPVSAAGPPADALPAGAQAESALAAGVALPTRGRTQGADGAGGGVFVASQPTKGRKGLRKFLSGSPPPDTATTTADGRDAGTVTWHCNGVAVGRPSAQLAKAAEQLTAALDIQQDGDQQAQSAAGGAGGGVEGDGGMEVTCVDEPEQESAHDQVTRQIGEAKLAELVAVVKATSGADARAGVAKVKQLMQGFPPSLVVLAVTVARSIAEAQS